MKNLINKLEGLSHPKQLNKNFPNFITSINFPLYKGLERFSRINFNFPLTVFVGQNGCGKSTVLQALETAPVNKSLSARWFSTHLDPIIDKVDGFRNCFWYEYYNKEADKTVQVLNIRIQRANNIDYWEPSRPIKKLKMDILPELEGNTTAPGRSKTRWNGVNRDVLYMDFRSELSAFDKYFHFQDPPYAKQRYKTKQDYIRYFSRYLKVVFDKKLKSRKLRSIEKVYNIFELQKNELNIISDILQQFPVNDLSL